jgi:hypothetical protein
MFKIPKWVMRAHFRHLLSKSFSTILKTLKFNEFWTPVIAFWKFESLLRLQFSKWELTWECGFIPSHSATFLGTWNVILGFHSWLAPLQALALVASPSLGLRHIVFIIFSSSFFHSSDIRNTRIFWRCSKRNIFKYFKIWKCEYVKYVNTMNKTLSKLSLSCAQTQRQQWSSIFKYFQVFFKKPKKTYNTCMFESNWEYVTTMHFFPF